jgi:hypothetical protein
MRQPEMEREAKPSLHLRHTSAYVSIRQHTSAFAFEREAKPSLHLIDLRPCNLALLPQIDVEIFGGVQQVLG